MVRIGKACHSREMRTLACKRTSLLVLDERVTGIDYLKKDNEKGREKGEGRGTRFGKWIVRAW
jgi:hypothetical protein